MQDFIKAREEFYNFLYAKFLSSDGPYCGNAEFQRLCEASAIMKKTKIFALDLGHLKQNKLGWHRLTAQGILYAQEQGFIGGGE